MEVLTSSHCDVSSKTQCRCFLPSLHRSILLRTSFFFFFHAEDGIRDHCVTGVQTCALLISRSEGNGLPPWSLRSRLALPTPSRSFCAGGGLVAPWFFVVLGGERGGPQPDWYTPKGLPARSEERRVGREGTVQR